MVHPVARIGYASAADAYGRSRPAYAAEIVTEMRHHLSVGTVVELGAGTGIITAELVGDGRRVVAVEPVESMRTALARSAPEADIREGGAEDIPVADGSAVAVVAAQAFHWFDAEPALDEIGRVLGPGGRLALLWNVRDQSVPWVAAYTRIMDDHAADTPRHATMAWRRAIDADPRFELEHERSVAHGWPTDAEGVVDRARSTSFIAALDEAERRSVETRVRELVAPLGDTFDFPYSSRIHVWRLVP